jgi:hypothetical protein
MWTVSLTIYSCFSSSSCIIWIDPSSFPLYFAVFFLSVHGRNISMESSCMKGNSGGSYSITYGGISW